MSGSSRGRIIRTACKRGPTKAAYYGITQDRVIVDVITGISSNIALSPNYWLDPKTANGYYLLAQYPEQSLTKTEDLLNIPVIGARTPLNPTSSLTTAGSGGSVVALQNTPSPGATWTSRTASMPRTTGAGRLCSCAMSPRWR